MARPIASGGGLRAHTRAWVFMAWFPRDGCGRVRVRTDPDTPCPLHFEFGAAAQDGVILAKDPIILLSVVLMALVARGGSVLGHLRLERILVAEAEVGPVAGLVLEALRVLDRGLQAGELALEVAIAAGRLLGPDAAEFFNQDGAVPVLAGLLVLGEALGVHVDGVELGERGLAVVHVVGGYDLADVHPLAIADGLLEFAVGGELDQGRLPPSGAAYAAST